MHYNDPKIKKGYFVKGESGFCGVFTTKEKMTTYIENSKEVVYEITECDLDLTHQRSEYI